MLDVKKCSRHGSAALAVVLPACTDAATRIAYDIEAGVGALRRSGAASYSKKHVPEEEPDGCAAPYSVQFSTASIQCCRRPKIDPLIAVIPPFEWTTHVGLQAAQALQLRGNGWVIRISVQR